MNNSYPRPCRKSPARASAMITSNREIEAVLEEVRQLQAAMIRYRQIVEKLRGESAA